MIRGTDGRMRARAVILAGVLAVVSILALAACAAPPEPEYPQITPAPDSKDPADWAELYPAQYEQWLATAEPRPAGKSTYKRGFDGGYTFDKLSELPFMPVLFRGWGFGIEYNEPRGHWWMLRDQQEIDPSRVRAGGACITCKSPYSDDLYGQYGEELMSMPYDEAVALIPAEDRELGVGCIDCHDNETLTLRSPRWTMENALKDIKLTEPNEQQRRIIVCGQCHCTYSVMKREGASIDVNYPWQGGSWGDISIETIIANLERDPARREWTQGVTGFSLGFIRHPDVEFFTSASVHFKAGLACPDCHMPYTVVGGFKTSDHDVISPLKRDMRACIPCHPESPEDLKSQVIALQNRNVSMLIDTGYSVAANAKLFEIAQSRIDTSAPAVAGELDRAAGYYRQAFYRVAYMGAENSMGFHNPSEGGRILRDSMAYSQRCDAILRQLCAANDISIPDEIDLELGSYLTDRGEKSLGFVGEQLFTDPFATHEALWPDNAKALGDVPTKPAARSSTRSD